MSIIAISGKLGSGKDTVGKIIQALSWKDRGGRVSNYSPSEWVSDQRKLSYDDELLHNYQIKKFATKLKQIVCLMTSCTLKQLEDQEFKKTKLDREWQDYESKGPRDYRWLLQTLGTESTREIIHPNFWINGLFADYKSIDNELCSKGIKCDYLDAKQCLFHSNKSLSPNWIITDLRFPNEYGAVKLRSGITIRVNRSKPKIFTNDPIANIVLNETKNFGITEHPSETALDSATFDYTIDNNSTIKELIDKVREILILENII